MEFDLLALHLSKRDYRLLKTALKDFIERPRSVKELSIISERDWERINEIFSEMND